jgi:hypothetical protein
MTEANIPGQVLAAKLVGSTAIYGSGADVDYCVLVTNVNEWLSITCDAGFKMDGSYPGKDFSSVRKGSLNLIVTEHTWLFEAYCVATEVMQKLAHVVPQSEKAKRVTMYELIKLWSRPI